MKTRRGRWAEDKHGNPRELRDRLVRENMGLVGHVLNRLNLHGQIRDEAQSLGEEGLLNAAERFDPAYGVRFSTYAVRAITNHIVKLIDCQRSCIYVPVHAAHSRWAVSRGRDVSDADRARARKVEAAWRVTSLDDRWAEPVVDHEFEDREEAEAIRDRVRELVRVLPKRQATVIVHRYGLGGVEPKTLSQVGEILGITKERVRQIEMAALERLREERIRWSA